MGKTFAILVRGDRGRGVELICASSDPELTAELARKMLAEQTATGDPIRDGIRAGRIQALEAIALEV